MAKTNPFAKKAGLPMAGKQPGLAPKAGPKMPAMKKSTVMPKPFGGAFGKTAK